MAKIVIHCTDEFKKFVKDHLENHGMLGRSESAFGKQAILDKIEQEQLIKQGKDGSKIEK